MTCFFSLAGINDLYSQDDPNAVIGNWEPGEPVPDDETDALIEEAAVKPRNIL